MELEEFYKGLDKATLRKFNKQREAKGLIKKRQPKETRAPPNSYSMCVAFYSIPSMPPREAHTDELLCLVIQVPHRVLSYSSYRC